MKLAFKRYLILSLLHLLCIFGLKAQINWGVKAAINKSTTFDSHDIDYYRTGYNAGIVADLKLSKFLFLSTGLLYSSKGHYNYKNNQDILGYINMPILAAHRFGLHFEILLGFELGYLVSAETGAFDYLDDCRRTEFAASGSARYKIGKRFTVDLTFSRGLTNILNPTQILFNQMPGAPQMPLSVNEIPGEYNPRNQSLQLGVIFFFSK